MTAVLVAFPWSDSRGVEHDLVKDARLSIGETATVLHCSESTVRRHVAAGELDPIYRTKGHIEVYGCVLTDFIARRTGPARKAA